MFQDIKYHAFFIEGASHVLALDLLQGRAAGRANLPWIQVAIRTLRVLRPTGAGGPVHMPMVSLADNLERMVQTVYPDFRATSDETQPLHSAAVDTLMVNIDTHLAPHPLQLPYPDPSMLFGLDVASSTTSPAATLHPREDVVDHLADPAPADSEWNFDFATADMEAFLSIDPNEAPYYQLPTHF